METQANQNGKKERRSNCYWKTSLMLIPKAGMNNKHTKRFAHSKVYICFNYWLNN